MYLHVRTYLHIFEIHEWKYVYVCIVIEVNTVFHRLSNKEIFPISYCRFFLHLFNFNQEKGVSKMTLFAF